MPVWDSQMSSSYRRCPVNSGKPKVLKGRDLPSVAKFIKSKDCKNVMIMLGAGVSTSAGIPDFRSPDTGLYSNLARLNLPYPEAVFEINFFRRNPVPFYELAHELYPGKFRPTITHSFIHLLAEKSLLHTCYTQNIDTLERRAGVPDDKIIEAHGSFASQRCIICRKPYDDEKMKEHIQRKEIAKCEHCGGYIKPDIVFFGESLPDNFIRSLRNLEEADLLIVIGTSLTVHPFAALPGMVDSSCPRVLINLDRVGDLGTRTDDVILLGKCDDIVKDICRELGWEEELLRLWNETEASVVTEIRPKSPEPTPLPTVEEKGSPIAEEALEEIEEQLAKLTIDEAKEFPTEKSETPPEEDKSKPSETAPIADKSDEETPSSTSSKQDAGREKAPEVTTSPEGKL